MFGWPACPGPGFARLDRMSRRYAWLRRACGSRSRIRNPGASGGGAGPCARPPRAPKFGLDIAVFLEDVGSPQPLFVEVKSYRGKSQGGVGFGNGRGEGPQVDLLIGDASALFDLHIRWAFVDATQPVGADRYAFLTCSNARAAVMGVVARGKQNNFKLAALRPHFVGWQAFSEQFLEFFASARGRR